MVFGVHEIRNLLDGGIQTLNAPHQANGQQLYHPLFTRNFEIKASGGGQKGNEKLDFDARFRAQQQEQPLERESHTPDPVLEKRFLRHPSRLQGPLCSSVHQLFQRLVPYRRLHRPYSKRPRIANSILSRPHRRRSIRMHR